MENEDFSSDSSDDDYVPTECDVVSEEEDSGDDEDFVPDDQTADKSMASQKKAAHKKKDAIIPRKRKGGIQLEGETPSKEDEEVPTTTDPVNFDAERKREGEAKREEEERKKADSLWADFMKDVGPVRQKPSPASSSAITEKSNTETATPTSSVAALSTATNNPNKISIVKEYDFAGETVKVVREVSADSKEAKEDLDKRLGTTAMSKPSLEPASASNTGGLKRPGGGGLSSVLGKINKKPKISVLDKSKVDWDGFKQQEGINDELKIHNRGKEGYLERQAFLQRTDLRQYEIERSLRLGSSTKQ